MGCKILHSKLFTCGLRIIFVLCTLAACKANENSNHIRRFINNNGVFGEISKSYCNGACGQTKFYFASVLKRYCQLKCPNSTIALLPLNSTRPQQNVENNGSVTPNMTQGGLNPSSGAPNGVVSSTTAKPPTNANPQSTGNPANSINPASTTKTPNTSNSPNNVNPSSTPKSPSTTNPQNATNPPNNIDPSSSMTSPNATNPPNLTNSSSNGVSPSGITNSPSTPNAQS
ncbi:PREDICTED: putative protein TPRXL [Ceratosolen solmsi marchali]|uniref:Uncharacterized protein n=1 Tax=Ceratosolen solmsi marchali TaxID=326594 RepID=A0AAJ7E1U4_9HYME|nr:PREDICTED: putative protein TPRXL [Ceratosolen solmsi marchali]